MALRFLSLEVKKIALLLLFFSVQLPDTFTPTKSIRATCDTYFEICISVCTSLSIWYLSEALAKTLTLPSYTCSSNIKVVYLHSLSRGFSWGSTDFFFECWLKYLSLAQMCRENVAFYYSLNWSGLFCFLDIREGNHYIVTQKKLSPT